MILIPAGENTELVGRYVGEKVGADFPPGTFQALAVLNDEGRFVAGVVIDLYYGHDCRMACATESPMAWKDSVLAAIFNYTFVQLGCARVTAFSTKGNKRSRRFLEGLGFVLEGNLRLGYNGVKDMLIYGLLASECRYLDEPVPPVPAESDDEPEVLEAVAH